ncbi:MAG: carbohydrate-binding protein, partial [bacterium]|nr:carbohydrate-binding protein [bacterium]
MKQSLLRIFFIASVFTGALHAQQAPYGGTARPVPGVIQAEDFDTGGEGVAYHDSEPANQGGQYRPADGVDIEACGEGGFNVGYMQIDEWMKYTLSVAMAGTYTIRVRTAAQGDPGGFRIRIGSRDVSGIRPAPTTGGWQTWTWVDVPGVSLDAGQQVMAVEVTAPNFNINYFQFVKESVSVPPRVSVVWPHDGDGFDVGTSIAIRAEASDPDGSVTRVELFANGASLGADVAAPWEWVWTPLQSGEFAFVAVATDNTGDTAVSDTVAVEIESPKLPDSPSFSVPHGFYSSPFNLSVFSDSSGAVIRYTLDGSDPRTSASAVERPSPALIRIDPASTVGRAATPAVVVRALAKSAGGAPITEAGCQTYVFEEAVKTQAHPGGDWPTGQVNGKILDYDMDPDVVNDSRYRDKIIPALKAIPVVCVNTELDNLFGPQNGIYVNPIGRGEEWERPASIELFDPRGLEEGFQINAGLRLRGGYSRIPTGFSGQYKHAFRLFFKKEYGKGKLNYPLFQDEGVSSFDCVDLRCEQNYSWSYQNSPACSFVRDVFSRDTQRDMGQAYTRSRAYHLFLNGMYWGLYQTQERPEASFAESYFGGGKDDYDVIKVAIDQSQYEVEATDGTLDATYDLWSRAAAGVESNALYFRLLGRNPDGSENYSFPVYVDPVNLADYLLIIYYTGNFDSPVSAFLGNVSPNNYYGIYNRIGRSGFRFFAHDAEHSIMDPRYSENSDYGYDRTGPYPAGDQQTKFNPQWLHQQLSENAEYRLQFADRVYRHFFNHGALTPEKCRERLAVRIAEIDQAVIGESARWGDAKMWWGARTRDDDWLPAVNWIMDEFFPDRTDIVLGQLMDDDLYPSIDPPAYSHSGSDILDDGVSLPSGSQLRLRNVNAGGRGTILYTLDGSDPRQIGGAAKPAAVKGGDDATVTVPGNSALNIRVMDRTVWSALHELAVNAGEGISGLALTEIHYHPLGEGDVDDREFE